VHNVKQRTELSLNILAAKIRFDASADYEHGENVFIYSTAVVCKLL